MSAIDYRTQFLNLDLTFNLTAITTTLVKMGNHPRLRPIVRSTPYSIAHQTPTPKRPYPKLDIDSVARAQFSASTTASRIPPQQPEERLGGVIDRVSARSLPLPP
jgi:hypothetical protein